MILRFTAFALLTAIWFGSGAQATLGQVRTVAITGQAAPGGGQFSQFLSYPVLNDSGNTAFFGVSTAEGLWSEGFGSLSVVAQAGQSAPGQANAAYSYFLMGTRYWAVLNDQGQVAFNAILEGPGILPPTQATSTAKSIWLNSSLGTTNLVARDYENLNPDQNARLGLTFLNGPALNNAGQVAFMGRTRGTYTVEAAFIRPASNKGMVLKYQDSLPGLSGYAGGIGSEWSDNFRINDAGLTAVIVDLNGPVLSQQAVWTGNANSSRVVTYDRAPAPGLGDGWTFYQLNTVSINNRGDVVFQATLKLNGDRAENDSSIWIDRAGDLRLIAHEGDPAPGLDGVSLGGMVTSTAKQPPVVNHSGDVAFASLLSGLGVSETNDSALWSTALSGTHLVAREGDRAPGTPEGVLFGWFDYSEYSINKLGQTAFLGVMTGPGIQLYQNDIGIWAEDKFGVLQLIVREGQMLEVAPGDSRKVKDLNFISGSGNEDGRQSGFNERGQVAFWAAFQDGSSGIFVSDAVLVPEPATLSLALFGALAVGIACVRRRGRRGGTMAQ